MIRGCRTVCACSIGCVERRASAQGRAAARGFLASIEMTGEGPGAIEREPEGKLEGARESVVGTAMVWRCGERR